MSLKNALLGLLTYDSMTGYDLKTIFEKSINHFWSAGASQIYRDLAVLEDEGYVSSHIEPQEGRPDKKIYTITPQGREAFLSWLNQFPPILDSPVRYEFLVRIFFGSQIAPGDLKFQIQRYIREQQEALKQMGVVSKNFEKNAPQYPEKDRFFWGLTGKMGVLVTQALIQWAEESLQELEEFETAHQKDIS